MNQKAIKDQVRPSTRVSATLLQRKCACGQHTISGGECAHCGNKHQSVQRATQKPELEPGALSGVPLIVPEVLRSGGRPLDAKLRAFFEPRFGHDFSRVRVHTDAKAAESAHAANALAYTTGRDIVFGEGQYAPQTGAGLRLVAHELAHTVQQIGVNAGVQRFTPEGLATDDARLEHEADRAAEEVVQGRLARVVGSVRIAVPQRQDKDKNKQPQPPKTVSPVEPSKAQRKMIDDARRAAAIHTQTAMFKASGVQGDIQLQEARRLAQVKFDWANPNMDQISEVLGGMGGGLVSVDVKVAGPGDPECGTRDGYVRGHQPPIILCPGFFSDPANKEGRIRTMVHEMAHVKGIGQADVAERYFPVFDCDSKGVFESADSWANYVHCLSGGTPDKPDEIEGRVKGGKTVKQAPANPGGSK